MMDRVSASEIITTDGHTLRIERHIREVWIGPFSWIGFSDWTPMDSVRPRLYANKPRFTVDGIEVSKEEANEILNNERNKMRIRKAQAVLAEVE